MAESNWQCSCSSGTTILTNRVITLEEQNRVKFEALKDMSAELKLSNDQGDLAIDGRHMNILAVWDEIDDLIKSQEKNNEEM